MRSTSQSPMPIGMSAGRPLRHCGHSTRQAPSSKSTTVGLWGLCMGRPPCLHRQRGRRSYFSFTPEGGMTSVFPQAGVRLGECDQRLPATILMGPE
jgi:hypothetical protein